MSKVLWVLTIYVSFVISESFALPPEVPQTPSWDNLSIEKPRSSVIPTWYDVLVTPQITKEVESKNRTGISYAELRKSLALNQLNLPKVVQKEVVLEAEEIDVPNSKNITKKTGTKMKDLYKNRFQKTKKEMRAELINNYLIPKLVVTESPKPHKKQKEYFPKEEKKPLPPLNSSVPLYVPIFRPQTNGKKKTTQIILEKPAFVNSPPNNEETIQNDLNKQRVLIQSNDKNVMFVNTDVNNKPGFDKVNEHSSNEDKDKHNNVFDNSEETDLINKVIQAIKDGELKLDEGRLKLNTDKNTAKLLDVTGTSDQPNIVMKLSDLPLDFVQTYQQQDKSETPRFVIQQAINQHTTDTFKPIVVDILNPKKRNPQFLNQQNVRQQPVIQQNILTQSDVNQQQFNPSLTDNFPINQQYNYQQRLDQIQLNQLLLNQQLLNQEQQCVRQQDVNKQKLDQQLINQQKLNFEPMNQQQINQPYLNQQSVTQQLLNQESLNPQQVVDLMSQQLFNQKQLQPQSLNKQQISKSFNQEPIHQHNEQPMNQIISNQQLQKQQSVNQRCVNQDSLNPQQINKLLSQLQISDSLENLARLNPEIKSSQAFSCPNNAYSPNNFKKTHKPVEITKNNPVVTIFKPDTVSLWESSGNFLKKRTMTVLVPVHAEKILTD